MTCEELIAKGEKFGELCTKLFRELLTEAPEGSNRRLKASGHFILVIDNDKPVKWIFFDDYGTKVELQNPHLVVTIMNDLLGDL